MSGPKDPDSLRLAEKAVRLGSTTVGCCEWKEAAARRVRKNPPCQGMTPEGIRKLLIESLNSGGALQQVEEKRNEYRDEHEFYYKAVLPVPGLLKGLFVELVLVDADPEYPSVEIVNAHEQGR